MAGLCLCAVALSGCAFVRAVTFQSDTDYSYQREGSRVELRLFDSKLGKSCEDTVLEPAKKPGDVRTSMVAAPLIAAGVGIALNVAESEIQAYLARRAKEFSAAYNASVNVPFFYERRNDGTYAPVFDCLWLTRTVKQDGQDVKALDWFGRLVTNPSRTAARLETEAVRLHRAAARTDAATRKVDVTVAVKIDATTLVNAQGKIATATVADKILAYPGLTTLGDSVPPAGTPPPPPMKRTVESSWFPSVQRTAAETKACDDTACKGVSALSSASRSTTTARRSTTR
jgi:hypothetical protein